MQYDVSTPKCIVRDQALGLQRVTTEYYTGLTPYNSTLHYDCLFSQGLASVVSFIVSDSNSVK